MQFAPDRAPSNQTEWEMNDDTPGTIGAPSISLVIPVRDEVANLAPLTEEIAAAIPESCPFELIFVDDGSADGTGAEITRLMSTRSWIRHLRHDRSCGKAEGVRTGVLAARAPIIVTLDGDGQDDPQFIIPLVQALVEGGPSMGLAAGQRVGRQSSEFKKLQSRVANAIRGAILQDGTRDTGCGLKAFRRDLFLSLPFFDGLHRFLPALARREGFNIAHVDVVNRPRLNGASKYGFWNRFWVGIFDLFGVWWLIRRRRSVPNVSEVRANAD
jgi:dolichol-phosphate mannosyltransferase